MKKFTAVFACIFALIFLSTDSFAQTINLSSRPDTILSSISVKCASEKIQDKIEIGVDSYKGYTVKRFTKPDRIVVDIPNAIAPGKQQYVGFKSKMISSVRYAQYDRNKNIVRIVIDTVGQPRYQVEEKDGKLIVYIVNQISKGVAYYNDGEKANFMLDGVKLVDAKNSGKKLFTEKFELAGKKYTITFPSTLAKIENKTARINDNLINTIQINTNKATKKTSISFVAKDKFLYEAVAKDDIRGTAIRILKASIPDRGGDSRGETPEEENPKGENPKDGSSEEIPGGNNQEQPNQPDPGTIPPANPGSLLEVKSIPRDDGNIEIAVTLNDYKNYNIMRLAKPDRIVLDIPNTAAPKDQQTISAGSSYVRTVRYAQYENGVARIVIDTVGQPQYRVEERQGQLAVCIENPTYKNITYSNSGDRIYFTLDKAVLTEGGSNLKNLYTGTYDETGLKYTIYFPSKLADIGYGTLKINDSLLHSIDIATDKAAGQTSITFTAKDKFVYNIMTRQQTNDTVISVLKPFSKEDRLIVIDPGHGGNEPGAVFGDLKEKTLNLDIALRLNNLLKSKGVKTYMIREEDMYVGLYERAYIANALNASLFLSIHNNAYYSSFKGTEVLYFPAGAGETGFGKRFAQILQDSLVGTLNTFDRKIKARPELVVLKATSMPAALAEVAFMTNNEDRQRLLDENFRQKAAEALCDAVIKALGEVK